MLVFGTLRLYNDGDNSNHHRSVLQCWTKHAWCSNPLLLHSRTKHRESVLTPGNICTEGCSFANQLVPQSSPTAHHDERPFSPYRQQSHLSCSNLLLLLLAVALALEPLFECVSFRSDGFTLHCPFSCTHSFRFSAEARLFSPRTPITVHAHNELNMAWLCLVQFLLPLLTPAIHVYLVVYFWLSSGLHDECPEKVGAWELPSSREDPVRFGSKGKAGWIGSSFGYFQILGFGSPYYCKELLLMTNKIFKARIVSRLMVPKLYFPSLWLHEPVNNSFPTTAFSCSFLLEQSSWGLRKVRIPLVSKLLVVLCSRIPQGDLIPQGYEDFPLEQLACTCLGFIFSTFPESKTRFLSI